MEEEEVEICKEENKKVLKVLEALKQASQDLQHKPDSVKDDSNSSAIKALLELENEAENIFCSDPKLSNLSSLLSDLKICVDEFQRSNGHSIRLFLRRRFKSQEISRVAGSIESEIQSWIDRETIENLVRVLSEDPSSSSSSSSVDEEEEKIKMLIRFESRVSEGFNRDLQDLVLKSKVFNTLESVLCNPMFSKRIREQSALAVGALVRFNKDVFVGEVLMGHTVRALISIGSYCSIKVLCELIRSIKSPLVDEIEANKEIPKIISFLSSDDVSIRVIAMNCVMEIGYFGRKEAIEAMIEEGLIKRLVELQRSELGGDLIEMGRFEDEEEEEENGGIVSRVQVEKSRKGRECREKRFLEDHPFASCVARFAIQLEVGEGLRQREKRGFKAVILRRVREACEAEAEAVAATILAEVLWGSSP